MKAAKGKNFINLKLDRQIIHENPENTSVWAIPSDFLVIY